MNGNETEPARFPELAEVVFGGPHYTVLFALAVLLFVVPFVGDQAIARMERRMGVAS